MTIEGKKYTEEFLQTRRRRNYAIFGGVIFLFVIFYIITIIQVGDF